VTNPECESLDSVAGQGPDGAAVDLTGFVTELAPVDYDDGQFTMVGKTWGITRLTFKLRFTDGRWIPSNATVLSIGGPYDGTPRPDYLWAQQAFMDGPCQVDLLDTQTVRLVCADSFVDFRWR